MPLFKSNSTRRSSVSPARRGNPSPPPAPTTSSGGFFNRNRDVDRHSSDDSYSSTSTRNRTVLSNGGFLGFGRRADLDQDPGIVSARQKVADAEFAEREADRALLQARQTVREAYERVKQLEHEAIEDARRAKAKQAEAKVIHKSAKGLGRHGT
ncbi:hypothetical protein FA15DRAFT_668736 [Coprinopsis marcescibilis]|uniref:Uncharacterized protein n=1 Tax=Coprinopsis marcescibilis TaxID=230819 RepID=A0A5C3KZD1_COPMA|nr:hypothetical protein FA15DRAFT_668736 [Coprinopsis marcescibilis]